MNDYSSGDNVRKAATLDGARPQTPSSERMLPGEAVGKAPSTDPSAREKAHLSTRSRPQPLGFWPSIARGIVRACSPALVEEIEQEEQEEERTTPSIGETDEGAPAAAAAAEIEAAATNLFPEVGGGVPAGPTAEEEMALTQLLRKHRLLTYASSFDRAWASPRWRRPPSGAAKWATTVM